MSPAATHLPFAAALAVFAVAIVGIVTVRRPALTPGPEVRVLTGLSLAAAAVASLAWGAWTAPGAPTPMLGLVRVGALAVAATSVRRWSVPALDRHLATAGLVVLAGADVVALADHLVLAARADLVGAAVVAVALGRIAGASDATALPVVGSLLGLGIVLVAATAAGAALGPTDADHRDLARWLFLVGAAAVAVTATTASLVVDRRLPEPPG